jgi:NitT/TauT family transport system ATP-binding protein
MKMRLSLARSLVLDPEYILLDEPLSAVDELTREVLQEELYEMWSRDKFTAILVTHNIAEAVYLSNRVVVMSPRPGKITDVVNIKSRLGFQKRTPEIRTTPQFSKVVNEIAGKLRTWK